MTNTTTATTEKAFTFKNVIGIDGGDKHLFFCNCNEGNVPHTVEFQKPADPDCDPEDYFTAEPTPAAEAGLTPPMQPATATTVYSEPAISYTPNPDPTHCPECGAKVTIRMNLYGRGLIATHQNIEYAKVYDNGHLISLAYGIGFYTYNATANKMGYSKKRYRLTFNTETGFMYHIEGRNIRNMTYKMPSAAPVIDRLHQIQRDLDRDVVDAFFNLCADRRGLKHIAPERFEHSTRWGLMPVLLKFPALENFPTYLLEHLPKEYRKPLAQMTKATEVFELFIGTSAKSIRKQLKNASAIHFYQNWSQGIKETSNMVKLLQHRTNTPNFSGSPTSIFPMPNEGDNPFHLVDEKEMTGQILAFAMEHFGSGDETILVNRILNERRRAGADIDNDSKGALVSPQQSFGLIRDIERMYVELKAALPDYELSYRNSFLEIHDLMTIEHGRLRNANLLIPYSKEELERYNKTMNGLEFRAAESTDRLRDIGRKLSICVGGYGSYAVRKETTIVQVYAEGQYAICLEVMEDRLIQTKTAYNHTPNLELQTIIKAWADEAEITYGDLYEFDQPSEESLESILRSPMSDEEALNIIPLQLAESEEVTQEGPLAPAMADYAPVRYPMVQELAVAEDPWGADYHPEDDLPF